MNMSKMRNKRVWLAMAPMDRSLNPAVRGVTDWKKSTRSRSPGERGLRMFPHSRARIARVPPTRSPALVARISLL
jgi:hypothetical protein